MPLDLTSAAATLQHLALPAPDPSFDDVLALEAARQTDKAERLAEHRTAILAALAAAGIATLTVTYDGYGDSGQLDSWTAKLTEGRSLALDEAAGNVIAIVRSTDQTMIERSTARALIEAAESFCYDLLATHHDGYENNVGGNGEFVFDVATGTIHLTHRDNYIAVAVTEHEF